MNKDGIVGTGRHTIPAPVALFFIKADQAFCPLKRQRPAGTRLDIFGLGFLPAHVHAKRPVAVILLNTLIGF